MKKELKLKVIEVEKCANTSEPILHLRDINKNTVIKKTISSLFKEKNVLKIFSKDDFDKIIDLKIAWAKTPEIKLLGHVSKNQTTEIILKDKLGRKVTHSIAHIGRNKDIINNLSPKDAYTLGYLLGCEEEVLRSTH